MVQMGPKQHRYLGQIPWLVELRTDRHAPRFRPLTGRVVQCMHLILKVNKLEFFQIGQLKYLSFAWTSITSKTPSKVCRSSGPERSTNIINFWNFEIMEKLVGYSFFHCLNNKIEKIPCQKVHDRRETQIDLLVDWTSGRKAPELIRLRPYCCPDKKYFGYKDWFSRPPKKILPAKG